MDNFLSEKTIQQFKRLNNKAEKSQHAKKWIYRSRIVKDLLLHIVKRRMSINKILNKRDRNYVKSVLIDEIGIHPATEKKYYLKTQ